MKYEAHPAAATFPMMDAKRLAELREDIEANGLLQDVVLFDGQILDGRNRYAACAAAGVVPRFRTVRDVDPFAYVWSLNGQRRDLTDAQRYLCRKACVEGSAELRAEEERIAEEARAKMSDAGSRGGRGNKASPSSRGTPFRTPAPKPSGKHVAPVTEAKARLAGVKPSTVERMDQLAAKRPDLAELDFDHETEFAMPGAATPARGWVKITAECRVGSSS